MMNEKIPETAFTSMDASLRLRIDEYLEEAWYETQDTFWTFFQTCLQCLNERDFSSFNATYHLAEELLLVDRSVPPLSNYFLKSACYACLKQIVCQDPTFIQRHQAFVDSLDFGQKNQLFLRYLSLITRWEQRFHPAPTTRKITLIF